MNDPRQQFFDSSESLLKSIHAIAKNDLCLNWFHKNELYPELVEIVRHLSIIGKVCAELSDEDFLDINYQKLEILELKRKK